MAPLSKMLIGLPSGPSGSTMAGMRLLGLMARNSGVNCSPMPMFTHFSSYGRTISSSAMVMLRPFGVGQKQTSIGWVMGAPYGPTDMAGQSLRAKPEGPIQRQFRRGRRMSAAQLG